ncbi:hypothetical protein LWI29_012586 [Acer saccharum]|uniref:Uncharacterized protein n=1 Tax=Acer saccharum TaxID=4024 RepID=A0AA39SAS2_ACESA|nr:hypothetical protein LWI29_012586 [Acer saccharum]
MKSLQKKKKNRRFRLLKTCNFGAFVSASERGVLEKTVFSTVKFVRRRQAAFVDFATVAWFLFIDNEVSIDFGALFFHLILLRKVRLFVKENKKKF